MPLSRLFALIVTALVLVLIVGAVAWLVVDLANQPAQQTAPFPRQ
jgi:hypothetical protein